MPLRRQIGAKSTYSLSVVCEDGAEQDHHDGHACIGLTHLGGCVPPPGGPAPVAAWHDNRIFKVTFIQ